jgi:hypothetical protein
VINKANKEQPDEENRNKYSGDPPITEKELQEEHSKEVKPPAQPPAQNIPQAPEQAPAQPPAQNIPQAPEQAPAQPPAQNIPQAPEQVSSKLYPGEENIITNEESISFIPNEQPPIEQRIRIPMQHRSPDPGCPLCPISGPLVNPNDEKVIEIAHQDALRLWSIWDPKDPNKEWISKIIEVAKEMGITVNEKQVEEHFSEKHRIEQPALPGQILNESFMEITREILPREEKLLHAMYRHRVLTAPQIAEVFYRKNGKNAQAAKKKAQGDLKNLAQKHLLFRYFPSKEDIALKARPPQFAKLGLWYLGKRAVPYIMEEYGLNFHPPYANGAITVSNDTMMHDIRASDVFVSLARAINNNEGKVDTEWGKITLSYDEDNWYGPGPRSLSLGFQDPTTLFWTRIKPDGFATLSIQRSRKLKKSLLPFWVEYDRGTKSVKDVAEQLFAYHLLALSGAAGARFPDLQAEGYAIPVLIVFYDKKQMNAVQKRLSEIAQDIGVSSGAPIALALDADWRKDPFAEGVVKDAWSGKEMSFLSYLVRASQALHEQRALTPGQVLNLDPSGAPYRAEGALSESGKAEGREAIERKREEEEERERKESIKASLERMKREAQARSASGEDGIQTTPSLHPGNDYLSKEEQVPSFPQPSLDNKILPHEENPVTLGSPNAEDTEYIRESNNLETGNLNTTQPEPIQPEPIQPEPIQPEPIQPEPTQPEPIQPEPIQPEPIQPEPIQPEPIQPELSQSTEEKQLPLKPAVELNVQDNALQGDQLSDSLVSSNSGEDQELTAPRQDLPQTNDHFVTPPAVDKEQIIHSQQETGIHSPSEYPLNTKDDPLEKNQDPEELANKDSSNEGASRSEDVSSKTTEEATRQAYDPSDPFAPNAPVANSERQQHKVSNPKEDEVDELKNELERLKKLLDNKENETQDHTSLDTLRQHAEDTPNLTNESAALQTTNTPGEREQKEPLPMSVGDLGLDSISPSHENIYESAESEEIREISSEDKKDSYIPAYEDHSPQDITPVVHETAKESIPMSAFPDLEAEIKSATSPKPMLQGERKNDLLPKKEPLPAIENTFQAPKEKESAVDKKRGPAKGNENIEDIISSEASSRRAKRRQGP